MVTIEGYPGETPVLEGFKTNQTANFAIEGFSISDPAYPGGCAYVAVQDTGSLPAGDYCSSQVSSEIDSDTSNLQLISDDITTPIAVEQQIGDGAPVSDITLDHVRVHNIGYHCDIGGNPNNCNGTAMVALWATPGQGITNLVVENSQFDHLNCPGISMVGQNATFAHDTFAYIESPSNNNCHAEAFQSLGVNGLTWEDNLLYNTGIGMIASCNGSGTETPCGGNWLIENSVFLRTGAYPIGADNSVNGITLLNNTFWDAGNNDGVLLRYVTNLPQNSTPYILENNIFDHLSLDPRLKVSVEDYNLDAYDTRSASSGLHDIFGQHPAFNTNIGSNCDGMSYNDTGCATGATGTDASLQPTSPGVTAGTTANGAPTTDILGNPRTIPYDIGAYDYLGDLNAARAAAGGAGGSPLPALPSLPVDSVGITMATLLGTKSPGSLATVAAVGRAGTAAFRVAQSTPRAGRFEENVLPITMLHRARHHVVSKRFYLGNGGHTFAGPGTAIIRVTLSRQATRMLERRGHMKVVLQMVVTPAHGKRIIRAEVITLERKKATSGVKHHRRHRAGKRRSHLAFLRAIRLDGLF